jgi:hypothetical protein
VATGFTLTLRSTTGSKTANSWITAAEADAILTALGVYNLTAWNALTTAAKEFRLILAAKEMASQFDFAGWPVYRNQALPFPRWFTEEDSIVIPDEIKIAQACIAYAIIHKRLVDISNPADGATEDSDISSISLFGAISISAASSPVDQVDRSALEAAIKSEHAHIYLMISDWVTQASLIPRMPQQDYTVFLPNGQTIPPLLEEVA